MKITIQILILLFVFIGKVCYGQNGGEYLGFIKEARKLYQSKEYLKSAEKYKAAFVLTDSKISTTDRYHAAGS
ncbi:hypothetical protein [Winogradskyella sp. R77965]|uniref:hypothetical protein n=1 Tax=Winogradskyella sp. R77965 TaxID=3093872 RepID=UPI0037DD83E6